MSQLGLNTYPYQASLLLPDRYALDLVRGLDTARIASSSVWAPSIVSQLDGIAATFASQRGLFGGVAATLVAHKNLAEQILQIRSAQDSIGRIINVVSYGAGIASYSAGFAGLLGTLSRYGKVQAELGALTVRPGGAALLRKNRRDPLDRVASSQ